MNLQKVPEDWARDLLMKRIHGRRVTPDCQPPYNTTAGVILVDRRSKQDRRRSSGATATAAQ